MEVDSVMVTGANRGIGLEFVRQWVLLTKPPKFLFATYRHENSTQALKEIRNASKETQVILIKMDVTKENERETARKIVEDAVGDKGLNLLINNAAVLEKESFPEITEENLKLHFKTNTIGPVMFLKEMFPLLEKSAARKTTGMGVSRAAVLNISAGGGSITELSKDIPKQWLYSTIGYRTSKAALNMAMRVVSLTVKDQGVLVVNMCPGWVKTDMGSDEAPLELPESITAMMKTLPGLNASHHGSFLNKSGETIPF